MTTGIVAPKSVGLIAGLSTVFLTGARHDGYWQSVAALHVNIGHDALPSISTQIAALRNLLNGIADGELGAYFKKVVQV